MITFKGVKKLLENLIVLVHGGISGLRIAVSWSAVHVMVQWRTYSLNPRRLVLQWENLTW